MADEFDARAELDLRPDRAKGSNFHPSAELRAVYSTNGARGKAYANRFRARYATSDFEALLADESLDAVLITSRNQDHARQALAALRAGKHVLVEKPMALTEAECRELCIAERESATQTAEELNTGFYRLDANIVSISLRARF